jgi:hypothetical protein
MTGVEGTEPGPQGPKSGAAMRGPRAGENPPAAAARARGAEAGRPEKAKRHEVHDLQGVSAESQTNWVGQGC